MKSVKQLFEKLNDSAPAIKRYLPVLFCLLVLAVYGFVFYRVQVLSGREPSSTDLATQSHTAQVPHIDQSVISQLKNLQDNSVSVKTLFSNGRSNPFNE